MRFYLEAFALIAFLLGAHLIAGYLDGKAEQARINERVSMHRGSM